jgi:recombination protein RecT
MNQKAVATPAPKQGEVQVPERSQQIENFYNLLEQRTDDLRSMLVGTDVSVDFFKQVALTAARETKNLFQCTQASIWSALTKAARDGLLPDGKDGKIIVRYVYDHQKKGKVPTAGWQDMFGGVKKKIRRSKEVLSFKAEVVYEMEWREGLFEYELGDEPFIRHRPYLGKDRGPIVAAYAVAKLANGEVIRDVMPIHEIHAIRDRFSDSWKAYVADSKKSDTPWLHSEAEMCRKTVGRRIAKWLPMDTDVRLSLEKDDDDVLPGPEESGTQKLPPARPRREDFIGGALADDSSGDESMDPDTGEMKDITPTAEQAAAAEKSAGAQQAATSDKPSSGDAAKAAEKKPAAEAKALTHTEVVADLLARLKKYPRPVQEEVFDLEIIPNQDKFTEEELDSFRAELKED